MSETYDIAVVVPMYNPGKKIKKCIKSILKQTFTNFVLIIVDDGSTDCSKDVCDYYAKKDNRIQVIHQVNKGSVEARKNGVLSEIAQKSKYIMFCDSDDTIPYDALETLYNVAEKYNVDCVCGDMTRIIHSIKVPKKYSAPCFKHDEIKIYDHDLIMRDLYVSCFGISNYPVSLWAKLYDRELITSIIDFKPIVKFIGDDLSVTLKVLPKIQNLAIISKSVYYYRVGGGTSKYMPYMLDDFLALYNYKKVLMKRYDMDSKTELYLNVELINTVYSYLQMCKYPGLFNDSELNNVILKCINLEEVKDAVNYLDENNSFNKLSSMLKNKDISAINRYINQDYNNNKIKRLIKKILFY